MNLSRDCKDSWHDVVAKVNRAVVFMDDAAAECLHWNGGGMLLLGSGATDIKQFSSFESCSESQRKAVFILSSPIIDTTEEILRDIVSSSQLQYIILYTSVAPGHQSLLRYGSTEPEDRAMHYVQDKLLEWMGNMNYTAEVEYLPLVTAPITRKLFTLPAYSRFFPLLPSDLDVIQATSDLPSNGGVDIGALPEQLQGQIKGISACLHSFLSQLSLNEDVYAMGSTSRLIAADLAQLPAAKTRRKNVQTRCSLVLIDRTLDMAECTSHQADTMLDRVLAVLPRLPGHHSDVSVNMDPVCSVNSNNSSNVIVPGCLAHPTNSAATALLQNLTTMKHKEGLLEVNRQIVEAASRESLPLSLSGRPGRVNADQLNKHIALFKGNLSSIRSHGAVLQLAQAVADTLPHTPALDALLGVEKGLLQCIGEEEEGPSPLAYLIDVFNKDAELPLQERQCSVEAMFVLLLFTWSLADSIGEVGTSQEQKTIRIILVKAIMDSEADQMPSFLQELLGETRIESHVKLVVQDICEKLRGLTSARSAMQQFRHVYSPGSVLSPSSRQPLLAQMMAEIFDPSKPDLHDLECKSTGFTDKLKKGFGLFMSVSKPRPSDHPHVIVFVVGGVTSTEAKKITEAAGTGASQVIVGGTSLLKPSDLLHRVLVQDNLHPK